MGRWPGVGNRGRAQCGDAGLQSDESVPLGPAQNQPREVVFRTRAAYAANHALQVVRQGRLYHD